LKQIFCALRIVDLQGCAIVKPEVKFRQVAVEVADPASIPRTADSCSFQAALEVRG
jgi:hypothetical protein